VKPGGLLRKILPLLTIENVRFVAMTINKIDLAGEVAVDENDNVFFFKGKSYSPQCNTNRLIVERHLAQGLATRAVLVPWAWVKFDISDYA
jgi:hypothetical protein